MFHPLLLRELQGSSVSRTQQDVSSSTDMLQRLKLQRVLDGHHGCVNCCSFDPSGQLLISGSDDLAICLWDWEAGRRVARYSSGHRANVFQARMLPDSNSQVLVTCAADGQVRVGELLPGGRYLSRRWHTHQGRAHKLASDPANPAHCFYSCGEDGEVLHYDLRLGEARGKQRLLLCHGCNARGTVNARVVELNAIHLNPTRPWQFAVGGSDQWARIYDCRRPNRGGSATAAAAAASSSRAASSGGGSSGVASWSLLDEPVARLCPQGIRRGVGQRGRGGAKHITCVMFSGQGELLATYNDDDIYLFDPTGTSRNSSGTTSRQHTSHTPRATTHQPSPTAAEAGTGTVAAAGEDGWCNTGGTTTIESRHTTGSDSPGSDSQQHHHHPQQQHGQHQQQPHHANHQQLQPGDHHQQQQQPPHQQQHQQQQPQQQQPQRRGVRAQRSDVSLELQRPRQRQRTPGGSSSSGGGASTPPPPPAAVLLPRPPPAAAAAELLPPPLPQQQQEVQQQQQQQQEEEEVLQQQRQEQGGRGEAVGSPSGGRMTSSERELSLSEDSSEDDSVCAVGHLSRRHAPGDMLSDEVMTDTAAAPAAGGHGAAGGGRAGEDTVPADHHDMTGPHHQHQHHQQQQGQPSSSGLVQTDQQHGGPGRPRDNGPSSTCAGQVSGGAGGPFPPWDQEWDQVTQIYSGHRNAATVKGVSFLGGSDEYVVSGSDCGHIYIWSKLTGQLLWWQQGDNEVVNCLEPHPQLPLTLATSGIERTVKVWEPVAPYPQPLPPEAAEVMEQNKARQGRRTAPLLLDMDMFRLLLERVRHNLHGDLPRLPPSRPAPAGDDSSDGASDGAGDARQPRRAAAAAAAAEQGSDDEQHSSRGAPVQGRWRQVVLQQQPGRGGRGAPGGAAGGRRDGRGRGGGPPEGQQHTLEPGQAGWQGEGEVDLEGDEEGCTIS